MSRNTSALARATCIALAARADKEADARPAAAPAKR
jgi:hypothetical protein